MPPSFVAEYCGDRCMLTDTKIRTAKSKEKTYRLADFEGLYLEVSPTGSKYWRLKYRFNKKEKRLAIGVYPRVSLKEARIQKDQAKDLLVKGIDPSAEKQRKRLEEANPENTFNAVADAWINKMLPNWAPTTAKKRKALLENDLRPWLGEYQIKDIRTPDIVSVLERIADRGTIDTANNAKQVLGQVCGYAKQLGKVEHNVATDLNNVLPVKRTKHRAAIVEPQPFAQLLLDIELMKGTYIVRTALALMPLVFQRPGEVCSMEWKEVDFEKCQWVIPRSKKKERNQIDGDHIVPLSKQAIALLLDIQSLTGQYKYVFTNIRTRTKHMNPESLNKALRRLGYDTAKTQCAHGFRASARTLMDEQLKIRIEWVEQQLAHKVKSPLGRAYDRTKFLPERHEMMQEWSDYLDEIKGAALIKRAA